jgi:hypothetical protein
VSRETIDPAVQQPIGEVMRTRLATQHPVPPHLDVDDRRSIEIRGKASSSRFYVG